MSESLPPTARSEDWDLLNPIVQQAHLLASEGKSQEARALFFSNDFTVSNWVRRLHLGQFLLETGNNLESIEQFSIVLDAAQQQENNQLRSVVCHNLAVAYRHLKFFDLASQFQQYSIAWGDLRSANHQTLEEKLDQLTDNSACDLTGRANDAILQEDYSLAEQLLNISLSREILYGDPDSQAADWGNLGIVQGLKGNHLRAVSCFRKAYQLHKQTNNIASMGQDLVHLGELFWIVGRFCRATRCLNRSLACFSRSHRSMLEQNTRTRLLEMQRLLKVKQHDPLLN
ncbi:tetratricopeptide repeat protein [Gimesia algae]|uniref:Tetratricopeptide repeat protein n=1 Tax=Gimesia algae TaxID=2527971 RepID=A0A517VEG7_9PLAN|nr:tetratricopeptide repeat protein [Gimesia algae]QDT91401.1 hypothetical protein Pan161_30580 [Gimesia algae]